MDASLITRRLGLCSPIPAWFAGVLAIACASSSKPEPREPVASSEFEQLYVSEVPLRPASAPLATRMAPPSAFETPAERDTPVKWQPACSMHAESAPNGIALVFRAATTSADQVAQQVEALAREIELLRGEPAASQQPQPVSFSTRQIAEFSASSSVERTDQGARLILTAKDPAQAQPLRARVLWQMSAFLPDSRDASGRCPIVPRRAAERSL
jgi:hypothetical protein